MGGILYIIALQMLFGDRGKFVAMVVGISFAALIMTQQPSILIGILSRTYSFVNDVSLPDIWVMDPGVQFVEQHKPIRDTDLWRIRGISGVDWVAPLFKNLMRIKLPDGSTKMIDMTGIDDATLIGAPYKFLAGKISDFRRNDAVFVDQEAAKTHLKVQISEKQTRPLEVGDVLEINDRRAIVMGLVKTARNFVLQPQVYTTYSRTLHYSPPGRRHLTYLLVKAKQGQDLKELCQKIRNVTHLAAYTADEFKTLNLRHWMDNTGIPLNFGISVLLGFIVGAAIAGQTFYNFIQENLKYYAALKAMGLKNAVLARMVMLQAMVVGLIGYGNGVGLTAIFGMQVHDTVLAFLMPSSLLLFGGIGVLFIVALSAALGVRSVKTVDASIVFRG
jgi:putative ABC transport system permease protein